MVRPKRITLKMRRHPKIGGIVYLERMTPDMGKSLEIGAKVCSERVIPKKGTPRKDP